jgi:formylglycine-generating enzyme required for sulfatase activity
LGGGYDLAKAGEWAVRLPTEYEWEKAARGREGLIYPYGNEFDARKGNISETGIKQTSAVGLFPTERSPYGIEEMSGNVWGWCLSNWAKPQLRAEGEDLRTDVGRTLRGGSWYNGQNLARAASRDDSSPDNRLSNIGFRVVLRVAPAGVPLFPEF